MKSMMFLQPGRIQVQDTPVPEPGPGEILVKVVCATTCGTDLKTFRRGHHLMNPPSPFGHEFAGDIVAVGNGVDIYEPGMRVVAHNSAPCQSCYYCKHGQENICEDILFNFGAYAEYILVPGPIVRLNTFHIPEHVSYRQASLLEPFVTVVHGQRVIQIQAGERVAIIGAGGPIGLMHLQMALRSGASEVIAVDLSDTRLAAAKQLGAAATINPASSDPLETILDLTDGLGVDVAIESAGAAEAWVTALRVVRKGGRVLWFGGLKEGTPVPLDTHKVHYGELSMHGAFHGTPLDVLRAFELICAGALDADVLISEEMPLEDVELALDKMGKGDVIKVAIRPNPGE